MIRTRIAPSPTGEDLHIGNLYTALINYAWAKKNKGKFVIRIEDTDRQRLVKGAEEKILKTLKDYGLEPDEDPIKKGPYGPYRQSERLVIYQKFARQLVEKGFAYYCFCSKERLAQLREKQMAEKQIPRYDGHCRNLNPSAVNLKSERWVVRLKVPKDKKIIVNDLLRGEVVFDSNHIDDQILLKSDGYPTYHLAVVVDDYLMKISHVIRAEEWLSSTPKHILLYEAFGWQKPIFCHLPILRNPDRSKLSKRKSPVWASWYLQQGYFPWAVLNYLALMGWSHPLEKEKEIFSMEEFIHVFDLKDLQVVGPAFDPVKLTWLNGEYIRKSQISNLKSQILNYYEKYHNKKLKENLVEKTVSLVKERMKKLSDYWFYCQFFFERPSHYEIDLSDKEKLLAKVYQELEKMQNWSIENIGQSMINLAKKEAVSTGDLFMILRVAITGKKISPPLNESMVILGKKECLERIRRWV